MEQPDVLVVEDDRVVTRALTTILEDAGYRVTAFHTGIPALEHAQHRVPAAAVLDIHLPDVSGLVLSKRMRELFGPAVPIIILSGDTSLENLNSLPLVGATHFFSKPVNATTLLDRLRELTGTATSR